MSKNLLIAMSPVTLVKDRSMLLEPQKGAPHVTKQISHSSQNLGWIVACIAIGALGFMIGQGPAAAHAQQNQQQAQPQKPATNAGTPFLVAAAPISREGSTRAIALFDQFGNMQLLQPTNAAIWMDPSRRSNWSVN